MKQFFTVTNNRIYAYCTQLGEKVMWDKEVRVMGRRKVRMILGRKEKRDVGMGICRTRLKGPNLRKEGWEWEKKSHLKLTQSLQATWEPFFALNRRHCHFEWGRRRRAPTNIYKTLDKAENNSVNEWIWTETKHQVMETILP